MSFKSNLHNLMDISNPKRRKKNNFDFERGLFSELRICYNSLFGKKFIGVGGIIIYIRT